MSRATTGTRSVTVFARIADGRAAAVRERLRAYREESPFAGMAGVHFARLVVLEHAVPQQRPARFTRKARLLDLLAHGGRPPRPDDLPHPYLMLTATVDGDPADFYRRLQRLGPDADAIWGDCTGYPGHYRQEPFVTFFTDRAVRADYTFAGSPEGSVAEITEALRLRQKVAAFAATAPKATDSNLRSRFRVAVDLEETVADSTGPGPELDLPDIQGLVLRGYGDHAVAAHLFLQITAAAPARRWLRTVAPQVTSAAEVGDRPTRALHLGISHAGLTRLEVPAAELGSFPEEFREGMHAREDMLSPGRGTKPWQEPFDTPGGVDVVLLLSATGPEELEPWLERVRVDLADCGLRVVGEQRGARMPDPEGDGRAFVEHFGFADGISQPRVAGHGRSTPGEVLPPGEFVLGQPDVDGDIAGRHVPATLGRNGSYLVYRKLEQDVPAFRELTAAAAGGFAGGPDDVAAGLVGRRRDGELLAPCPAGAHVRRANPRGTLPGGSKLTRRHLMLRRGIPYGPYLPPGAEDDGAERGLLFLAVVGDPGRQFEFVQTEWLADGNVFGRGREEDIFTTAGGAGARILLEGEPPAYVAVPRPLVTCRGGEYFLLPGLAVLRALGGPG